MTPHGRFALSRSPADPGRSDDLAVLAGDRHRWSIYFFGLAPHIPMLFGVCVASLVALRCGHGWQSIQDGMVAGITNALPSIIILMIIGVLIGVWILGGVVPTLIYYGLQVLSPTYFLAAATVICAIASLATGTSWGTTGRSAWR
jgi:Na+:H+ antiporter, NhaC family